MLNLEEELSALVDALNESNVEYALCGALALAVHGFVRATLDIDILIQGEDHPRLQEIAERIGYTSWTKRDPNGDYLSIDPLHVTPATEPVWQSRLRVGWGERDLDVVSPDGLVALKRLRAQRWDLADIGRLFEEEVTGTIARRISRVSQLHKLCLSLAKANPALAKK